MQQTYRRVSAVVALAALAAWTAPASATWVNSNALGSDLGGGTLVVTFQFAGPVQALITAGPGFQEGSATTPDFTFSVAGDTWTNPWSLTNLRTDDWIVRADFILPPSLSLFDDDSSPSTVASGRGRAGVVYVSGPPEIASGEYQPWADVQNQGDMYEAEFIEWQPLTFIGGQTYVWQDDTDVIPEPATLALLCGGAVPVLLRRIKRRSA